MASTRRRIIDLGATMAKNRLSLQVLRKIPVFHALQPSLVRRLVVLCESRELAEGEILCRHDTASEEMYILLAGPRR
jgi:hypothetical protein